MSYKLLTLPLENSIVLELTIDQKFEERSASPYAAQQKLARSFLGHPSLEGILITPLRDLTKMAVIGLKDLLNRPSAIFERFCEEERVEITRIAPPDSYIVEQCLRYTLFYFLENEGWYRVGHHLMPSTFLQGETNNIPKINVDIHPMSTGEVYVKFDVQIVSVYICESWQLGKGIDFECRWVHVLPKLGRGRVVAVHESLPSHAPFKNYEELRIYWKNCYGYDLPQTIPKYYFDVKFNTMRNTMLYPFFLVWSSEPQVSYVRNAQYLRELAEERVTQLLNKRKWRICGETVQLVANTNQAVRIEVAVSNLPAIRKRNVPKMGAYRPQFFVSDARRKFESLLEKSKKSDINVKKQREEDDHNQNEALTQPAPSSNIRFKPQFSARRPATSQTFRNSDKAGTNSHQIDSLHCRKDSEYTRIKPLSPIRLRPNPAVLTAIAKPTVTSKEANIETAAKKKSAIVSNHSNASNMNEVNVRKPSKSTKAPKDPKASKAIKPVMISSDGISSCKANRKTRTIRVDVC